MTMTKEEIRTNLESCGKFKNDLLACGVIHEYEHECPKSLERLRKVMHDIYGAGEKFEASMESVQ